MTRAFAPGRVNLIGEHTDYNEGLCLPFAIERGVTVRAELLPGGRFEARAEELAEKDAFAAGDESGAEGWRAFVRGTVDELVAAGHELPGARLTIQSDLPRGAGLSSSAALEAALALALLDLAEEPEPNRIELAKLCSRVENDRVGAQTGLLDQLAVLLGEDGHALRLDCRSLETERVPVTLARDGTLAGWTLATLCSGASHANAGGNPRAPGRAGRLRPSGYNDRREECRRACAELGIDSLRDASPEDARSLPAPLDRRVRHVLSENERVEHAVAALRAGDPEALGRLLDASHASLRDDYEVSIPGVEAAVATCKRAGAAGARIMGGGFGGSVLALFPPGAQAPGSAVEVRPAAGARLV